MVSSWFSKWSWPSQRSKEPEVVVEEMNSANTAVVPLHAPELPYQAIPGVFDEMVGTAGTIGPAWQACAKWFANYSTEAQLADAQKIQRLVFENFFDPQRGGQSWQLDLAPLILDKTAWSLIERAAVQRARLYNELLADLYGPQSVFVEGLVPASLVQSDESYLRPLHGLTPTHGHLTFLALDFARDPQGNWRIIDSHTETPAGHGFALANRMVISEVSGNLFRNSNALRIGPFYQSLIDDLLSRPGVDDPMVAVLAPSPNQSSFVGHSFMARHMQQRRVEGSDLRVVGNRVYLKTVDGLQKIDLLVRAIESHKADPLELSPDSFDGPTGLVEACRQNPDLIVNALGTAVVENRGLSGYLGLLSQKFLGEDLVLPDAPRLWLGDPQARAMVLADLDQYIIHSAQEGTGSPGEAAPGRRVLGDAGNDRAELEADIRFNGARLVAERPIGFSTAPAWTQKGLKPEHFAIRVYVSSIGGSFSVMPGGLALSVDDGLTVALTSSQARSRDVWVVSDDRVIPNISLKRLATRDASVQRKSQALQSRAADNLFWLGRYCERADGTLRVARQALQRSAADLLAVSSSQRPIKALRAIIEKEGAAPTASEGTAENADRDALWAILPELCSNEDKFQGLPNTFGNIRNIAVLCRDRLSEDSWRILMGLSAEPIAAKLPAKTQSTDAMPAALAACSVDIIEASESLLDRLAAFAGMSHENMTRNRGWAFVDLGRRIERALHLATLLLSLFKTSEGDDLDSDDMVFALQTADSFLTFRSRYRFAPQLHLVLDLLVIDEMNPRSLAYQLAAIFEHISALPKSSDDAARAPEQRLALELLTKVQLADVNELARTGEDGQREALKVLLTELIRELPRLSELVSRHYFNLTDEQPQRLHFNQQR